ncbi:MAG: tRNA (uridine(54)-C5)-methyltransferase TrmA [Halieaceae bacterium]|nr:tRNA (uridine(54)-C5)-methyltransferase TrmA [Halieaceae bacterium]
MIIAQPERYAELFQRKCDAVEARFAPLQAPPAQRFASPPLGYRMRAEFRLWHQDDDLFYAMFDPGNPRVPHRIDQFPIAAERIQAAMPVVRQHLLADIALRRKVFQAEFLATLSGQLLVTLVYHRPLDDAWEQAATTLGEALDASIVGRAKGEKRTVGEDYVVETLPLPSGPLHYRQYEQAFTQPNARVNCEMIQWACAVNPASDADLLELYCGNGNFTLPLAARFRRVLATEVAKSSIRAAEANRAMNQVNNLAFIRLSAEEMAAAMAGDRPFRRLASLQPPLEEHRFSTLFVDPPRAGLDRATLALAGRFERIVYVSCNPDTLLDNLAVLKAAYRIEELALFDQFPYTDHMECGVVLVRR